MDDYISKDNNNPINWDGNNKKCKLCDKDAENMDEYCENHQRCYNCGDNEDCDCKEEMSQRSDCCGAKMDSDIRICYSCKEHCDSVWETEVREQKNTN